MARNTKKTIQTWEIPVTGRKPVKVDVQLRRDGTHERKFYYRAETVPTSGEPPIARESLDLNALENAMTEAVQASAALDWQKKLIVEFKGGDLSGKMFGHDDEPADHSEGGHFDIDLRYTICDIAQVSEELVMVRTNETDRPRRIEQFLSSDQKSTSSILDYSDERVAALEELMAKFGVLTSRLHEILDPKVIQNTLAAPPWSGLSLMGGDKT